MQNTNVQGLQGIDRNVKAFLALIRETEGTAKESNPYAVCYGYSHVIRDFSDHPYFTGEWMGKTLPDSMCRNVGLSPGCKSTAAGAYQFIRSTWDNIRKGYGLKNFSPVYQDQAAIYLLKQRGAYDLIVSGKIESALKKASAEWASLPYSTAGQGKVSLQKALSIFREKGGSITA